MRRPSPSARAALRAGFRAARAAVLGAGLVACGGGGTLPASSAAQAVEIVAENVEFRPARLELPAETPVRVVLRNRDDGVPHGLTVSVRTSGVPPRDLGELPVATGPVDREFQLAPLSVGPYLFSCPVHPHMQVEVDVR